MIQDIAPHCYHNEYQNRKPQPGDVALCYRDRETLILEEEQLTFPRMGQLENVVKDLYEQAVYLFAIDDQYYYMVPEAKREPEEMHWVRLSYFRTARPMDQAFAAVTGHQLYDWYRHRKFCGSCGTQMIPGQQERMVHCPKCGLVEYPKICPAVIVGITNGDKIVLSKYAGREYKKYALIAGFAEIGESIEDTVRREVYEEVGLKVKNLQFYKSQPWSFTDTLLFGFFCQVDGDDTITMDERELSVAQWASREEVPEDPEGISLTREMMTVFKGGRVRF